MCWALCPLIWQFINLFKFSEVMPESAKTVLIAGSTGLTGQVLTEKLLSRSDINKIKLITRRSLSLSDSRLQEIVTDFDDILNHVDDLQTDEVFCCLGSTLKKAGSKQAFKRVDVDYVLRVARLSLQKSARGFHLVSSLGASLSSPSFYLRTKAEVEEELMRMPFQKIRIYRPSFLDGDRHELRLAESLAGATLKVMSPLLRGALKRLRPTSVESLAETMIEQFYSEEMGKRILEAEEIGKSR